MENKELFSPRYIVLGDFPMSLYSKGDIIEGERAIIQYGTDETENDFYDLSTYPNLFRKLNWFEKRAIEDLPVYVKYMDSTSSAFGVYKANWGRVESGYVGYNGGYSPLFNNWWMPATEEEYLTQLDKK